MLPEQKKKLEEVLEFQGLLYFFNSKNIQIYSKGLWLYSTCTTKDRSRDFLQNQKKSLMRQRRTSLCMNRRKKTTPTSSTSLFIISAS